MYAPAIAAGAASSFFYIGGIVHADLARRRNEQAAAPYLDSSRARSCPS